MSEQDPVDATTDDPVDAAEGTEAGGGYQPGPDPPPPPPADPPDEP